MLFLRQSKRCILLSWVLKKPCGWCDP